MVNRVRSVRVVCVMCAATIAPVHDASGWQPRAELRWLCNVLTSDVRCPVVQERWNSSRLDVYDEREGGGHDAVGAGCEYCNNLEQGRFEAQKRRRDARGTLHGPRPLAIPGGEGDRNGQGGEEGGSEERG